MKRWSHTENGRKRFLHKLPRPLLGTYFFVQRGLKLVQLVKTARKHERFIEDLGDDIRVKPGFGFYLRPSYCFLAHMQSPVSCLLVYQANTSWITRQGHLRRFDQAIARFVDGNFNHHFFRGFYGTQAVGASASHAISPRSVSMSLSVSYILFHFCTLAVTIDLSCNAITQKGVFVLFLPMNQCR